MCIRDRLNDKFEQIEYEFLFSVNMYNPGIAMILAMSNNSGKNNTELSIMQPPLNSIYHNKQQLLGPLYNEGKSQIK